MVRPATLADARALARIQVRAWHHAFADVVFPEDTPTVDEQAEAWTLALASGVQALVTVVADEPRAFVAFGPARDEDAAQAGAGEVYALFVDPVAQGAGHGGLLLQEAEGALRFAGHAEAVLWTLEAALARELYERRGWVLDRGPEPEHGVLRVPEVRYRRALHG